MGYSGRVRILFTRFPLESALGGAEKQTLSLMCGLRDAGHEVKFLGSCPVLLRLSREHGIPAQELHIGPPPVTKWGAVTFVWRRYEMRQTLRMALQSWQKAAGSSEKNSNDTLPAIVMLSLSEKLLLTEPAKQEGCNVFWLEHDPIGRWLKRNPWLPMLRRLSALAVTITVSELSRKLYLQLGWSPERTVAIPNGVEIQSLIPNPNPRPLTIGCMARLHREKGVDMLVRAAALANVNLRVVGQGPEEQALRLLAKKQRLDARYSLEPRVEHPEDFYAAIDVLVLPSVTHDPFGLVAAEAMLCGTPVIVTDRCGIADYLENGTDALVVKAGDPQALAEAIRRLMDDATLRETLRANGARTAAEKFSTLRMVKDYEALLQKS